MRVLLAALLLLPSASALAQPAWPKGAKLEVAYRPGVPGRAAPKAQRVELRWPAATGAVGYTLRQDGKVVTLLPADARAHAITVTKRTRFQVYATDAKGGRSRALTAHARNTPPRRKAAPKQAMVLAMLGTRGSGGAGLANVFGPGAGTASAFKLRGEGKAQPRLKAPHPTRSAVVSLGEPAITGDLPPEATQRVLRRAWPRLRHCTRGKAEAEGEFTAELTIQAGRVVAAQVGGPEAQDALSRCFAKTLKRVRFPKGQGGAQITQPIAVKPRG